MFIHERGINEKYLYLSNIYALPVSTMCTVLKLMLWINGIFFRNNTERHIVIVSSMGHVSL